MGNIFQALVGLCDVAFMQSSAIWVKKLLKWSPHAAINVPSEYDSVTIHVALQSIRVMTHFLHSIVPSSPTVLRSPSSRNFTKLLIVATLLFIDLSSFLLSWFAYRFWRCPPRIQFSVKSWVTVNIHASRLAATRIVPSFCSSSRISATLFGECWLRSWTQWPPALSGIAGKLLCCVQKWIAGVDCWLDQYYCLSCTSMAWKKVRSGRPFPQPHVYSIQTKRCLPTAAHWSLVVGVFSVPDVPRF